MAWTEPQTWLPGTQPGATELNREIRDNLRALLPLGTLIHRVANRTVVETVVENRFLECNGVAVSRTTYAALFNYFNSLVPALPFGAGNGSTTFNLPELAGRAPYGEGTHTHMLLGDHDENALASRVPRHIHQVTVPGAAFAEGGGAAGLASTFNTTEYRVPYQVTGVWYIKYTS